MKRTVVVSAILAGLMALAGPAASASSGVIRAVADRSALDDAVSPAFPVRAATAVPPVDAPARTAPRQPRPQPLAVVRVPFLCAVHLAEGSDGSDDSD